MNADIGLGTKLHSSKHGSTQRGSFILQTLGEQQRTAVETLAFRFAKITARGVSSSASCVCTVASQGL